MTAGTEGVARAAASAGAPGPVVLSDTRAAATPSGTLVLCTVGRSEELAAFLRSLACQAEAKAFDLVVVDQNPDPTTVSRALASAGLRDGVLHLRCPKVSLSYARNVGLQHARGRGLAFPDDDCEYPPDLLDRVCAHLRSPPGGSAGICFRFTGDRIRPSDARVEPFTSMGRAISFSFFLDRERLAAAPAFSERLGVGTYFGACEETEFLMRVLPRGAHLALDQGQPIRHPPKCAVSAQRERSYGRGFGALAKTLLLRGPRHLPMAAKLLLGPAARLVVSAALLRREPARCHAAALVGRVEGFLKY